MPFRFLGSDESQLEVSVLAMLNALNNWRGVIGKGREKIYANLEESHLNIRDLMPGMSNVNVKLKVLDVSEPEQIITGKGVEHKILVLEAGDDTGTMKMVLWDDTVIPLKVGDVVQVKNGFVSSFKGEWRLNVGKYGEVNRI